MKHFAIKRTPIELWFVPPLMAPVVLPHVRKYLRTAYEVSGNIYDELEIMREVALDRMGLWVVRGSEFLAAMTTRIYQTHDARVLHIIALGGQNLPEWFGFMDQIESYACRMCCDKIRVEGREGWSRKLPTFVQVGVILEKRMTHDGQRPDTDYQPDASPERHAER